MAFLNRKSLGGVAFLVALVAVVLVFQLPAEAGKKHQAAAGTTLQKAKVKLGPPVRVDASAAAAAAPSAGLLPLEPQAVPFRPTMDQQAYEQAKTAAAAGPLAERTAPGAPALGPALAPAFPPALTAVNFAGDTLTGWYPPDTTGAVGHDYYCQIVNSRFTVYDKTGGQLFQIPINDLFNYYGASAFDPQVLYDPVFRRWIVSADAFPEGGPATPQYFIMAVSDTADPTGTWLVWFFNTRVLGGEFFDYPHIGQDSRSIIVTANNFYNAGGYKDSRFFAWPKSMLYNELNSTIYFTMYFGWTVATIMPPVVLDTNRYSYLVSAAASDTNIWVIPFYTPATPIQNGSLANAYSVPVPSYGWPANALQPGTLNVLDTLDSRFVNAGTQTGTGYLGAASLFQTHTVGYFGAGSIATPRYYEFILYPASGYLRQWDWFFCDNYSNDFNASIAANRFKDAFVTWSSTNWFYGINAQVRFGGRRSFADLGSGNFFPGVTLGGMAVSPVAAAGSATYYDWFRWGDYSCVTIDPAVPSGLTAWITNEVIYSSSAGGWGSQIAAITYLP